MTSIQAFFPKEERIYNINRIFDFEGRNVKWESKKGQNLTIDDFNNVLRSSILELELASGQEIPNVGTMGTMEIMKEYKHFLLRSDSKMFVDKNNYSIDYNTDENSATFTIMPNPEPDPKKPGKNYNIYGILDSSKGKKPNRGGRPRSRATFRQQRVKRAAAKSRRRTRRV